VNSSVPITGLQKDINRFVLMISALAIFFVIVISIVWGAYLNVQHPSFMTLSSFIANAISVLVALVPEGLPLAMSMGLSIIANRLCKEHKVIVKQLSIVETIGSMSLLASDKTGTLTMNKMTFTDIITSSELVPVNFVSGDVSTVKMIQFNAENGIGNSLLLFLQLGALFCNQAKVEEEKTANTPRHSIGSAEEAHSIADSRSSTSTSNVIGGNGVDVALMKWILSFQDLS